MNLKEKLKDMSDYAGKLRYEELIEKMEKTAQSGKRELYIDYDEVLYNDIEKLKSEGLSVTFLEGGEYSYCGTWEIGW